MEATKPRSRFADERGCSCGPLVPGGVGGLGYDRPLGPEGGQGRSKSFNRGYLSRPRPEPTRLANSRHARRCATATERPRSARHGHCESNGAAYLDRAAPRLASAKFLVLVLTRGLDIEPGLGSNCPGRIFGPGPSALASRFLAFCPAFAFARWRALALVMSGLSNCRRDQSNGQATGCRSGPRAASIFQLRGIL